MTDGTRNTWSESDFWTIRLHRIKALADEIRTELCGEDYEKLAAIRQECDTLSEELDLKVASWLGRLVEHRAGLDETIKGAK